MKKPMILLILNWRDVKHPLSGGAEISLMEHASYWQKNGYTVIWFASAFPHAIEKEKINDITIIRKGSHFTVHFWAFMYFLQGKLGNPDIIIDCFHAIPFFSTLYAKRSKVYALINEVTGNLWFTNLSLPLAVIGYFLEPYFFHFYKNTLFITGSISAKNNLIEMKIPEKNITVIPHGFHQSKLQQAVQKEKYPTILFIGRISKDKGIDDAMKAFTTIAQKLLQAQFWVIGKEEKKEYMKYLLSTFSRIKEKVTYFGFVSDDKKYEYISRAWLLIHPSQKEGWGLTVIEAASQGVPTVGYNVAGLQDSIQDKKTGILVPPGHPELLAEAVISLVQSNKEYKQMSKEAKTWSQQFSWEKSTKASLQLILSGYK